VQLLEIHDISLKAAVSTTGPGDVLTRFRRLLGDFEGLQTQYDSFREDFALLAKDVEGLQDNIGAFEVLRGEVGDCRSSCKNLSVWMDKAVVRMDDIQQSVVEVEEEATATNERLTKLAADHPPAAVIFELVEDCFWKQSAQAVGANSLMLEHTARMDAEAGMYR